jgi:cyanophycinase
MIRNLFLFGDFNPDHPYHYRPFIEACHGQHPTIAVLMQGEQNWQQYFNRYEAVLHSLGATAIPVLPEPGSDEISADALATISNADGILVGGGNAFRYIKLYSTTAVAKAITSRYKIGIPYAGISAGAILTIRLGILPHFAIKPHFTQGNRFVELLKKMDSSGARYGVGMDNLLALHLTDETHLKVYGGEKCYIFTASTPGSYKLDVLQPTCTLPDFFRRP